MKHLILLFSAIMPLWLVDAAGPKPNSLSPAESADGWTLLFDGQALAGWAPRGDARWSVDQGVIVCKPGTGGGFLSTIQEYADFQLHVEFWIDGTANSGVFLRCPTTGEIAATNAYEVNIYDPHEKWPTGSINEVARTRETQKTAGQWNTYDLTADGDHLVVKLNGKITVDVRDGQRARGTIALQNLKGDGEVRFRNIKLKPLRPTAAR
jgi:hypothetical protein